MAQSSASKCMCGPGIKTVKLEVQLLGQLAKNQQQAYWASLVWLIVDMIDCLFAV